MSSKIPTNPTRKQQYKILRTHDELPPALEEYRDADREHRAIPYDRGLSPEALAEFRKKAIREIFFSPGYMVRVLVSIRSVYELRDAASSAWRLLRGVVRRGRSYRGPGLRAPLLVEPVGLSPRRRSL